MERKEVKHYIDHMDANGLVNLCKDINEWKYKSGKLSPGLYIKSLGREFAVLGIKRLGSDDFRCCI